MMTDPQFYLTMAAASLTGLAMVTVAALTAWRGWLTLKSQQMQGMGDLPAEPGNSGTIGTRIELADLKERIRKLEAIAAGVDL